MANYSKRHAFSHSRHIEEAKWWKFPGATIALSLCAQSSGVSAPRQKCSHAYKVWCQMITLQATSDKCSKMHLRRVWHLLQIMHWLVR